MWKSPMWTWKEGEFCWGGIFHIYLLNQPDLGCHLSICCCSVAQLCPTLCNPMDSSMPGSLSTISWSLLKLRSTELVMPSNHLILFCPLLPLHSIFPSIKVFPSELDFCNRWPKYWKFSFSAFNEYWGLIFFRFDLLTDQGTLKSLLQHHSLKISILWHSAFLMAQLTHLYMTTGKTIALTIETFVSKVMSLLLNTLSRFIIAYFPRSKRLLISWLQ